MKKKVMIAAAIAVMAGAGAYFGNASNSPSSDGRSDLLLENAEALSDIEVGENGQLVINCFWTVFDATEGFREPCMSVYKCLPCGEVHLVTKVLDGGTCS
ncbi:MAG: hypothetical protein K1V71_09360 [Paramuribaculum sp.]|jgi:hypothetical protein